MIKNKLAAIVLAAGLGTRMNSKKAKVLCKINGKPMVFHSVELAVNIAGSDAIVVVGYQADTVKRIISETFNVKFAYQKHQMGTGHAVLCSIHLLSDNVQDVIILCGDLPLLSINTIRNLIRYHIKKKNDISVLAADVLSPKGYGRIVLGSNGNLDMIIEESDASEEERKNTLVNAGVFCVKKTHLKTVLSKVRNNNIKNEIYLTDIVKVGRSLNLRLGVYISDNTVEAMGVNTFEELNRARILSTTSYS